MKLWFTMNAPYRDQLLPVSSRYTAVVLQGCLDAGISPQQFYDADEKYRKAYKARAAPCPKNALPNANQARCAAQRAFLCNKRRNSYEEQTQNKAGLVAVAGGRNCAHKSGRSAARFCGRCRSNPETAQTATLDPDAAVLYADLPDAPCSAPTSAARASGCDRADKISLSLWADGQLEQDSHLDPDAPEQRRQNRDRTP